MRVVFLGRYDSSERLSGPAKVAKRLFNHLSKLNNDVLFIEYFFKSNEGKSDLFLRLFGKEENSVNQNIMRLGIIRLFVYLLRKQPDIIHIVTSERFIIPLFLSKIFLKGKIVVTKHSILRQEFTLHKNSTSNKGKYKDLLLEWLEINHSEFLFFLSVDEMNIAKNYYTIDESKITVIENGVDFEFSETNISFPLPHRIGIVFYNGFDLKLDRGLKFVIEALNKIENNHEFNLFVLGKCENDLKRTAKFPISVQHILDQTDLINYLKDKQIILKSNTVDTFPVFVGECMAMGMVPVISDKVGVKRCIENGKNGYVYNGNTDVELVKIIEYLLMHKDKLTLLSKSAQLIYNQLKWENIAGKYLQNYTRILSQP